MTKPAIPPPVRNDIVEIDAMDVAEWESGQSTPQTSDANLAELVRKTATSLEPPTRVQTVARQHTSTQTGAPVIRRPPSRARTAPPGPAPKPTRPRTSGGPPAASARAIHVPGIPAGPGGEARRSLAPVTNSGIDFSLPITATSPGMPAAPASKPRSTTPMSGGIDFSLPSTATGEGSGRLVAPTDPPRPRTAAGSAPELSRTAIAASESGAQPSESLSPTPAPSPFSEPSRGWPRHSGSLFGEPSRVGPGHNASPAGGVEPNTAWPPRPIPVDASSQPARLAASDPSIRRSQQPGRHDAGGADRLKVALSHRRLWWIGGGIASASVAAILAALALPNPEALPPEASQVAGAPAAQATGPRRAPRPEQPVDRAAADLRERVRLARDAAAAGVPMTPPAVDPPMRRASATDPLAWIRSDEPESAGSHRGGKKPARRLVVDYTARLDEPAPPSLVAQTEEDPAIGRARNAYTTGNQLLFVGDLDSAVRAYREALAIYPGYVGGYRGLGLAYEQLGDTTNALASFRVYVTAVPNARDIVLIKKRIAHLQRR
jgi:Tetratricopeptide repeat